MKCLEPIQVGSVRVKNRFSLAPMNARLHTHDGYVTDRVVAHYRRIAQGGVGLMNLELHTFRQDGIPPYFQVPWIGESYVPGMKRIADAIHSEGAVCVVQLGHFGKFSPAEQPLVVSASVPSLIPPSPHWDYGHSANKGLHEATTEEVEEVADDYARAARWVMEAGFNGVLVHGAHGFLPQQFTSPHSNRRTDKWGQDRLLFSSEVIKRIKKLCGPKFLVNYRLSGDEYYQKVYSDKKGYTVDDLPQIVTRLVQAGVDLIDLSAGALDVPRYFAGPDIRLFPNNGYGGYLPLAKAAKSAAGTVPVVVTGRMNDPEVIERALSEGLCDLVGMARQFLSDPDFPKKLAAGRSEDIRRCIACGYCAVGNGGFAAIDNHPVQCAVNTEIGWADEEYHAIRPTTRPKKVMVAGGGAAGMEAARVLKLRGHEVTLYEKGERLGGQLWFAGKGPGKSDINFLTDYLATQLKKLKVEVRLNTPVTRELVAKEQPDALVIATGAEQFIPKIPGIDGPNVQLGLDALMDKVTPGRRVVIIGGEEVACEVGDYLSEVDPSRKLTMTSLLPGFATKGNVAGIMALLALQAKGAEFIGGVRQYVEITKDGVVIVDASGTRRLLEADTVVVAAGARATNKLAEVMGKGLVRDLVFTIGDATAPRGVFEAIREASIVAQHI